MKKFISFLLVITLLLSLGMTAMAKKSPTTAKKSTTTGGDTSIGLYDANDKLIARVPAKGIVRLGIASADKLPDDQKEAFKAAYEDAMTLEGKLVRRFFWLDIADEYKNLDGFAYAKLSFTSQTGLRPVLCQAHRVRHGPGNQRLIRITQGRLL